GWAGTDCEETARSFFPKKERRGETSLKSAIDFQCRIAFVRFSIDRDLWDSSTEYELSASAE
ncbi:MAG TPA: hypothetical protein VIW07_14095, partial [Candidatus Udaeobacter sp.]